MSTIFKTIKLFEEEQTQTNTSTYMQVKTLVDKMDKGGKKRVADALKKSLGVVTEGVEPQQQLQQLQQQQYSMEAVVNQVRQATRAIKHDDTIHNIIVEIRQLAEKAGIDASELRYSENQVSEAFNQLASEVYGLEEAFTDKLSDIQNQVEELEYQLENPDEELDEAGSWKQQAAIAIAMKNKGKKPKSEGVAEGVRDLGYDAQSLIMKLRRDVEEKRLQPTRQAVLSAARELAGDMDFAPELLVRQVLGQGVAEGWQEDSQELEDWSKEVNKRLYRAHESQRPALARQLSKLEQKNFGSSLNQGSLTELVHAALMAIQKGQMVHYDPQSVGQMPFGNIVGNDARLIASSGMSQSDNAGYQALKRAGILDTIQQFLQLRDFANSKGEDMLKYSGMDPVAGWMQFVKDTGWNKDDLNEEVQAKTDDKLLAYYAQRKAEKEKEKQQKGVAEGNMPLIRAVDEKGRTQSQWVKLVKAKFPNAKIQQAKMIDGPCQAILSDGRKIYWSKVENQLDEIIDPSTVTAKALRYIGGKFATAFPWLAVGGAGAGLAASGLLAPLVASMGGITTALSTIGSEMAFSAGIAGTYAAPSIIQTIKDLFAADENSIQAGIKRWVEKHVGDDNDVHEFMSVHSKAAYEGKPGFRWRAKEWPVKMNKEQAEAYLEKNEKSWLDYEKQKVIDAEKQNQQQGVTESVDYRGDAEELKRQGNMVGYHKTMVRYYDALADNAGHRADVKRYEALANKHHAASKNVEEEKQRLDPKCWTGKHKEGTKMKGGVRVNNCVPNESAIMKGIKV